MSYLHEIRKYGRDANPFFVLMGIDVVSFGNGQAELSMEVRPDMMNGAGWMQGGLYLCLCDEAMALALFTAMDDGQRIATISESTSFLQGIQKGKIKAFGRMIRKGRRVAFTEGWTADCEDKVLSRTSASFAVF
jgi:acyl-CoA thioesterase